MITARDLLETAVAAKAPRHTMADTMWRAVLGEIDPETDRGGRKRVESADEVINRRLSFHLDSSIVRVPTGKLACF